MRDRSVGNVRDILKFAFLRTLVGGDRLLGVTWYYVPDQKEQTDDKVTQSTDELGWARLDPSLYASLAGLPERSVVALERAAIWPNGTRFIREPVPARGQRDAWVTRMQSELAGADIVYLDPDVGLGLEDKRHASITELLRLRRPERAITFITIPGQHEAYDEQLRHLHERLDAETNGAAIVTLRTNVSVPSAQGSASVVQRAQWFTVVDCDDELRTKTQIFAERIRESLPRARAKLDISHWVHLKTSGLWPARG